MSEPCFKCGVARSCKHRTVDAAPPIPAVLEYEDGRRHKSPRIYISGGGLYRRRAK